MKIDNYFNKVNWSTNEEGYWSEAKNNVNYRIWIENKIMYVAFQHTIDTKDFEIDFNFYTRLDSNGLRIHRGFSRAYEASSYEIIIKIATKLVKVNEIIIIGYSMGGVYASLLHADLKRLFSLYKISTYVYGCPNFLLKGSKNDLFNDITYICNEGDLVTITPPFYKKGNNIVKLKNKNKFPSLFNHLEEYYERSYI